MVVRSILVVSLLVLVGCGTGDIQSPAPSPVEKIDPNIADRKIPARPTPAPRPSVPKEIEEKIVSSSFADWVAFLGTLKNSDQSGPLFSGVDLQTEALRLEKEGQSAHEYETIIKHLRSIEGERGNKQKGFAYDDQEAKTIAEDCAKKAIRSDWLLKVYAEAESYYERKEKQVKTERDFFKSVLSIAEKHKTLDDLKAIAKITFEGSKQPDSQLNRFTLYLEPILTHKIRPNDFQGALNYLIKLPEFSDSNADRDGSAIELCRIGLPLARVMERFEYFVRLKDRAEKGAVFPHWEVGPYVRRLLQQYPTFDLRLFKRNYSALLSLKEADGTDTYTERKAISAALLLMGIAIKETD